MSINLLFLQKDNATKQINTLAMDKTNVPKLDFNHILQQESVDTVGDEFAVFKDISLEWIGKELIKIEPILVGICLQGTLQMSVNMKDVTVRKNDLLVILPDHMVQLKEASDDFSAIFIAGKRSFVDEMQPNQERHLSAMLYIVEHPLTTLTNEEFERMTEWHSLLQRRMRLVEHPYQRKMVSCLLATVFYDACGIFEKHNADKGWWPSRLEEIFMLFLRLVPVHCKEERSVTFYAKQLNISTKYLTTAVTKVSGQSTSEWITRYVILEAKSLLRNPDLSIKEIATTLNFASQSFFGKFFKNYVGISPNQYRREQMKRPSDEKDD